jgi:sulfide:quinone oxidoreductase
MSREKSKHRVVIVGGGAAGVTVAARLQRAGVGDVAVIEPSLTHYYQPLWTLVGAGQVPVERTARPQRKVMPRKVTWYRHAATEIDPESRAVGLDSGESIGYDFLVVAPGLQLNWDAVSGLPETLGRDGVSSNYSYSFASATWSFIRNLRSGTAVFTMPSTPIKCGGAPLKIAFLAADYWRRTNVADDIEIVLAAGTPTLFTAAPWIPLLEQIADRYGIQVRLATELVEVNPESRHAVMHDAGSGAKIEVPYDLMHVTPPQSAPDWIRRGPLADPANPWGYISVDAETLRHTEYAEVFALGDATNLPTSKTGAAVRKQAPVLVENLQAAMAGRDLPAHYSGYTSCPVLTAHNRLLLAEFDYSKQPTPTMPLIDTFKERYDMYLLKRYGLPAFYWNLMLRGRG